MAAEQRSFTGLPGWAIYAGLFCALLAGAPVARSQSQSPGEYEVKLAFIYNFAKFVDWPAGPAPEGNALRLCIMGQDPFGKAIDALQGKPVGATVWKVALADAKTNLRGCQVLFIAASESANLNQVLESIKGSAVLTVGDTDGYAERGVIINFYLLDNKVRFEINVEAAKQAGLTVSSQLLRLARIITPSGGPR